MHSNNYRQIQLECEQDSGQIRMDTGLIVSGITKTDDEDIIEAVERPDKSFILGLQYHPEIAVVRGLDDDSLVYFTELVKRADT